jgi:hypothetical protein
MPRRKPAAKPKQLPVSLTPHLRRELEAAAARSGNSLGEEVRQRLFRSFADETVDQLTRDFAAAIIRFALDVKRETGREWHAHPAANRAMRHAITARLARLKPEGDAMFVADELPANRILTTSAEPETIGTMIEAFNFRNLSDAAKAALTHTREELFERFPSLRKDHEHD